MKTSRTFPFPFPAKSAGLALLLVLGTASGTSAQAANDSARVNVPGTPVDNTGVGSTGATDRHDTVHSNESRINTVGKVSDPGAMKLSRGDRRFVEKAARSGLAELRTARLAVERSADPRVKSYAQQLVADHEKANAELNELAGRKGVSLPQDENDHLFKSLSEKTGADFDQRFVGHMSDDHEDDIELFEKAARKSDDADVAAFASKQLPTLQEHRRVAEDLEKSLKR